MASEVNVRQKSVSIRHSCYQTTSRAVAVRTFLLQAGALYMDLR